MSQGKNGDQPTARPLGRGPILGEIIEDGDKQYACIGVAVNKLFAVCMVADVNVDGPARMYCMPLAKLNFDHETGTWKTPPKSSLITDIAEFFKRG